MSDTAKREWVERTLGVAFPDTAIQVDMAAIRAAVAAWRDASEAVDAQVSRLQSLLQNSPDPQLQAIGEYGMAALSGGNRTRMIAAAMELESSGSPPPDLLKRTAAIAASYRAHLASDSKVRGFDNNPFGVAVSIRATLEPALQQLENATAGKA